MARIIVYTGKGGVGKTTIAAATAVRCAELGRRTVVLSTDPAHSLGDSLDTRLGPEPTRVLPNLWAQETDIYYNLEKYWGTVKEWLVALMVWQGADAVTAEEIAVLPGMEELANLLWVNQHYESGDYDVIIVDAAPTGETLRLLSFPEAARWWVDKLLPIERRFAQVLRPVVRPFTDMPVPGSEVFDAAEDLLVQLERLHRLLSNADVASMRLVMNPERMVVRETQRTYTYLNLYGYVTDLVIVNKVLPEVTSDDPYFDEWRRLQQEHLAFVEEAFSPLPILHAPLLPHEVADVDGLRKLASLLFGEEDPSTMRYRGIAQELRSEDGHAILSLNLPFVPREEVRLSQRGDELLVQVGRHRRNVLLPRALSGREAVRAQKSGDRLDIYFGSVGSR